MKCTCRSSTSTETSVPGVSAPCSVNPRSHIRICIFLFSFCAAVSLICYLQDLSSICHFVPPSISTIYTLLQVRYLRTGSSFNCAALYPASKIFTHFSARLVALIWHFSPSFHI
ncbi:hypothetical protein BDR07DRAFT_1412068, partial [Suillus spraguei]